MKRNYRYYTKTFGIFLLYFFVFFLSVYFTMMILIKGEELNAPDLVGKSIMEAEDIADNCRVYLKKVEGTYDKNVKPNIIINQVPSPGVRIKEKSIIKVFIPSQVVEVVVPNLSGLSLNDCDKILGENDLIKRYISYIDAPDTPVDIVVGQSYPVGTQVPRGTEIDLLVSRGSKEISYIMPDLIGKKSGDIMIAFEQLGLKIPTPTKVSYPGVESGIVVKQYPLSGFPINNKARISIEVSK